jgi:hypothetical protein
MTLQYQKSEIEKGARELIKQHGKQARSVAARRALGGELSQARDTADFWRRIAEKVRQLEDEQ